MPSTTERVTNSEWLVRAYRAPRRDGVNETNNSMHAFSFRSASLCCRANCNPGRKWRRGGWLKQSNWCKPNSSIKNERAAELFVSFMRTWKYVESVILSRKHYGTNSESAEFFMSECFFFHIYTWSFFNNTFSVKITMRGRVIILRCDNHDITSLLLRLPAVYTLNYDRVGGGGALQR